MTNIEVFKEIYVARDIKTNKIDDILIRPIWTNIDEDRTWFYFEWLIDMNNIIGIDEFNYTEIKWKREKEIIKKLLWEGKL